jgi:hypothetical protein
MKSSTVFKTGNVGSMYARERNYGWDESTFVSLVGDEDRLLFLCTSSRAVNLNAYFSLISFKDLVFLRALDRRLLTNTSGEISLKTCLVAR